MTQYQVVSTDMGYGHTRAAYAVVFGAVEGNPSRARNRLSPWKNEGKLAEIAWQGINSGQAEGAYRIAQLLLAHGHPAES